MKPQAFLALTALLLGSAAEPLLYAAAATPLREVTEQDVASWKAIQGAALTPDGQWLAYLSGPHWGVKEGGASEIVVRNTQNETERRYAAGHSLLGAGNLKMSPSGRWIAFAVAPKQKDGDAPVRLEVAL